MYIPKQFRKEETSDIVQFIRANSFGVLFSQHDGLPTATHLPFILSAEEDGSITLLSHMAKANPQWKTLDSKDALVVFNGPHAYISASWYEEENTVSTWNYLSAHASGKVEILQDEQSLLHILKEATDFYEKGMENPWRLEDNLETVESMLGGIVGLRIRVQNLQGKWKLNQHHSTERKERVVQQLKKQPHYDSIEIARLMELELDLQLNKKE
ncbi:FMN-binding negative transcriptional regulator [Sutcliffiella horikoshii]|uniref:FMN-binding negative transcriptional regulator n=1 Tax=Sutcliffiella horikoshii TaxID=79883 RepID=A0AA94WN56_9BACI|nr:FMN-binding negative transcriptional regulator [Sutcliffiella horikoshii]TYS58170.1 FMN-binding negative transcriptional regulator [Sutcliffiella horikoshii]